VSSLRCEHLPTTNNIVGSFIPANSLAFIINFSENMSTFVPSLALDFIFQWFNGFYVATTVEKITCLQYVSPWIRNLGIFMEPSSIHFDEPRVRECIRLFINITIQELEVTGCHIMLANALTPFRFILCFSELYG
jgi:hypothetical protein